MGAGTTVARNVLKRLRVRREQLELSQAQVADAIGVNPSYIGLLERGERVPSLDVLVDLSEAVGMRLGELFGPEQPEGRSVDREVELIRTMLARWPTEYRRSALRVLGEFDRLVSARAAMSAKRGPKPRGK